MGFAADILAGWGRWKVQAQFALLAQDPVGALMDAGACTRSPPAGCRSRTAQYPGGASDDCRAFPPRILPSHDRRYWRGWPSRCNANWGSACRHPGFRHGGAQRQQFVERLIGSSRRQDLIAMYGNRYGLTFTVNDPPQRMMTAAYPMYFKAKGFKNLDDLLATQSTQSRHGLVRVPS